jgi:hypothetical protein
VASSSALADLRDPRRDVEGASGSASLLEGFAGRRELSPFLREGFRRVEEGWGVLGFSSMGSVVWLYAVSSPSCCEVSGTDSADDMTALPLAFLERAGAS